MTFEVNPIRTHRRTKGDTRTPLKIVIVDENEAAVNLSGLTLKFKMVRAAGTDKVAETASNVTVTDAANGEVQYDFQAADVDEAGEFFAWFIIEDGSSEKDHVPHDGRRLRVQIYNAA